MEKLTVKNFLVIKHAECEVGKINVIIGPQASGKSVLAKLLYFFREFLSESFINSLKGMKKENDLKRSAKNKLESYFKKKTLINSEFEIKYEIKNINIVILGKKRNNGKISIEYNFSETLLNIYKKTKKEIETENSKNDDVLSFSIPSEIFSNLLYSKKLRCCFQIPIFIPAGRSFFTNIDEVIYDILKRKSAIDPFIVDFGSSYRNINRKSIEKHSKKKLSNKYYTEYSIDNFIVDNILFGEYKYKRDKGMIVSNNNELELMYTSSGQQEVLPMLLALLQYSFSNYMTDRGVRFFIEEPEAHLFPVSQKHIIALISLLYGNLGSEFFLTTHSPYILVALNNLMLAKEAEKQHGKEAVEKVIGELASPIDYDDVRAYTFDKGVLKDIRDKENKLIGTNIIDSVSEEFDDEFDRLLGMLAEPKE